LFLRGVEPSQVLEIHHDVEMVLAQRFF